MILVLDAAVHMRAAHQAAVVPHFGHRNEKSSAMSRRTYIGLTILSLSLWVGSLPAQAGAPQPSPGSTIVVTSGEYQLTEQMLEQALFLAQILAGADFSASDTASLRAGLIAEFQKDPAKDVKNYDDLAKFLRNRTSRLGLAIICNRFWFALGQKSEVFDKFKNEAMGKLVLKYNPVLVNSDGMIITMRDVDGQFESNAFVAQIAGVALPTQADKDRFVADLPLRFASMPAEERERLRDAQIRLASVHLTVDNADARETRAIVESDIRGSVHSSEDVARVARQVENDSLYGARYDKLSVTERLNAISRAQRVNSQITTMGRAVRDTMRNSQLSEYRYPGGPCMRNCVSR